MITIIMLQEGDINIIKDATKPGSVVHACYPSTQEPTQARQSYTVNPHSKKRQTKKDLELQAHLTAIGESLH